jgi:hypothetical protein
VISRKEARDIAKDWHDGQASALYSFASTGIPHRPAEALAEAQSDYDNLMHPGPAYEDELRGRDQLADLIEFLRPLATTAERAYHEGEELGRVQGLSVEASTLRFAGRTLLAECADDHELADEIGMIDAIGEEFKRGWEEGMYEHRV